MAKGAAADRLERLERLKGLLKANDSMTVKELAAELGVSIRSLSRDIELLRMQGVPIEADRGRGGGVRLQRQWSFGRLHLDFEEGIDLLLSIALAEKLNSPLMLKRLRSIRQKLATSFPESQQGRIKMLRNRILIGPPASERVLQTYRMSAPEQLTNVNRAFFEMRVLEIRYADEASRMTTRRIEPQFLLLSVPAWYLLAWDRLRDDIRTFRIDRIHKATVMDAMFRLRDRRMFIEWADSSVVAAL
jgi:predicted DNA-binding transcriptional regulator YafY